MANLPSAPMPLVRGSEIAKKILLLLSHFFVSKFFSTNGFQIFQLFLFTYCAVLTFVSIATWSRCLGGTRLIDGQWELGFFTDGLGQRGRVSINR